jgi:hypothetical protein
MTGYLVISSIWSAEVYDQALFVSASSTSELVLVFMPLYQWAALVCVALLSLGLREVFSFGSGSTLRTIVSTVRPSAEGGAKVCRFHRGK